MTQQQSFVLAVPEQDNLESLQSWQRSVVQSLGDQVDGSVQTDTATATELLAFVVVSGQSYAAEVLIIGRQTGGSGTIGDSFGSSVWLQADTDGVTVVDVFEEKDQAAWADSYAIESGKCVIKVAGESGKSISWSGRLVKYQVGI